MISCLTERGRVGMTAVGDSPEDAQRIYLRWRSRCCCGRHSGP